MSTLETVITLVSFAAVGETIYVLWVLRAVKVRRLEGRR